MAKAKAKVGPKGRTNATTGGSTKPPQKVGLKLPSGGTPTVPLNRALTYSAKRKRG